MVDRWHPDVDDILLAHEYASFVSKVRTEGFHISRRRGIEAIQSIIDESKEKETLFRSAAVYLQKLISKHPFADGDHRTAYIVTVEFLRRNDADFVPEHVLQEEELTRILKKKVKFKSLEEISNWIREGEFK